MCYTMPEYSSAAGEVEGFGVSLTAEDPPEYTTVVAPLSLIKSYPNHPLVTDSFRLGVKLGRTDS